MRAGQRSGRECRRLRVEVTGDLEAAAQDSGASNAAMGWPAGVKFGRKPKLSDYQRAEAIKRRAAGETLASIAKSYGVHVTMISRL